MARAAAGLGFAGVLCGAVVVTGLILGCQASIDLEEGDDSAPYPDDDGKGDSTTAGVPSGGSTISGVPIPSGFSVIGKVSTAFEFWGRYTTGYAGGGSGPSLRWDNYEMDKLNFVSGFEFKIGPEHGDRNETDSVGLKMPRCTSKDGDRGVYIPYLQWYADGRPSRGGVGKEIPHPKTTHLRFNDQDPRPNIGDIKDGQWHGFLAVVYNDGSGVPTIELYFNRTASGRGEDYVFVGRSKDTGSGKTDITPGNPLRYSSEGSCSGTHPLQIRIDEIPKGSIELRKMFAVEVKPVAG